MEPELHISSSSAQGCAFSHLQQVGARGLQSGSLLRRLAERVNHVEQRHQAHSVLQSGGKQRCTRLWLHDPTSRQSCLEVKAQE